LLKEEEDQLLPHKRKRKPKDVESGEDHHCDVEPQQKKPITNVSMEKSKKRHVQPPPLNFQELLKIAEKKQYEPIIIEKPKKEESLPMMTKKEREKYLEEKRIEESINARRQGKCVPLTEKPKEVRPVDRAQKPIAASSSKIDINIEDKLKKKASVWSKDLKISKESNINGKHEKYIPRSLNVSDSVEVKLNATSNRNAPKIISEKYSCSEKKDNSNNERYSPKPKSINDKYIPRTKNSTEDRYLPKSRTLPTNDRYVPKSISSSSDKYSPKPKSMLSDKYLSKPVSTERYVPKSMTSSDEKCLQKPKSTAQPEKYVPKGNCSSSTDQYTPSAVKRSDEKYSPRSISSSQSVKSKLISSKDRYVPAPVNKSNKLPSNNNNNNSRPKDLIPKQFPPRDMVPKQFPPRDMVPKQFPPSDIRRRDDRHMPMRNKRQVIESDSEYDSELDDFIDDGPEDEADYSKVISEIFKYDKSKYKLSIIIIF